jgi:hypothetical protein
MTTTKTRRTLRAIEELTRKPPPPSEQEVVWGVLCDVERDANGTKHYVDARLKTMRVTLPKEPKP